MPKHDYRCGCCGRTREDVWTSNFRDASNTRPPVVCECGASMDRLPSAPNFQVNGFNAQNGYSK